VSADGPRVSADGNAFAIGPIADLDDGAARRFDLAGTPVCVVRIGDRVHAIGDVCTHQDISLSEGEVEVGDCTIECWKHGSAFSLETGAPLTLPATRPVPVYPVTVDDDEVTVHIPAEVAT
jgi:3-phenylpropionate/trans-cinnamate dioxygenase ferredoxin subunit